MSAESTDSRQSNSSDRAPDNPSQLPPTDALKSAWSRVAEIGEFARAYVAAQSDLLKVRLRNIVILAVLGIVALLGVAALIVTLIVMLFSGLSQLVAAGLGGRMWAGNLIVSVGMFAILGSGTYLGLRTMRRKWLKQTQAKYERFNNQQRERFGEPTFEREHDGSASKHQG